MKTTSDGHVLLLSIQPKYANLIFEGKKTTELRRVRPRVNQGDFVLIYVSSPDKVLLGSCEVEQVIGNSPKTLWTLVRDKSGLKKTDFFEYFEGVSTGYGIFLNQVQKFNQPILLSRLQQEWAGFHPPQSYRYLTIEELDLIGSMAEHDMTKISSRLIPRIKQSELEFYPMSSLK